MYSRKQKFGGNTMKKYNVVIHYAGAVNIEIDAANEDEARKSAQQAFDEISDADLIAELAEIDVCDCWEIN